MKHYNILDISIYQIQLFLTLAEERNFSLTAELLNLTQPTLSKRISALENIIGFSLFDRSKRPIELTSEGEMLYKDWKQISKRFEESVQKIRSDSFGSIKTLSYTLIDSSRSLNAFYHASRQLEQEFPEVRVIREYKPYNRWRDAVLNNDSDIAFALAIEIDRINDQLDFKTVVVCPKLVAVLKTNPLAKKDSITYDDLRDQQFIINSPLVMPSHYEFISKNTKKHGFEPNISRFTQTTHDLIGCMEKNNEVVVCDAFLRDIDSAHIKVFELPDTYSGLMAVWRKDNKNPYIQRFSNIVEEYFKQNPLTLTIP